jgi:hypothetical protein
VLQGVIKTQIEFGRSCGVELSEYKTKVMRISRLISPIQLSVDQKQAKDLEYFNYLCSIKTKWRRMYT